jgi:hypothetical protein
MCQSEIDFKISEKMKETIFVQSETDRYWTMSVEDFETEFKENEINRVMAAHVLPVWSNIQTYGDLIKVNLLFLNGKLKMTPYHLGPIDPETFPFLTKLRKINKMGFVTVNSQPGTCKEFDSTEETYLKEQRAFLQGFFSRKFTPVLIRELFRVQPNNLVIVVYKLHQNSVKIYIGETIFEYPQDRRILFSLLQERYKSRIKDGLDLTTKISNQNNNVNVYTAFRPKYFRHLGDEFGELPVRTRRNFTCSLNAIMIIRLKKCKTDLMSIVLKALDNMQ